MKSNCQCCGDKLSSKKITEIQEALEYSNDVLYVCDDCYDMQDNFESFESEDTFDSDSGL